MILLDKINDFLQLGRYEECDKLLYVDLSLSKYHLICLLTITYSYKDKLNNREKLYQDLKKIFGKDVHGLD